MSYSTTMLTALVRLRGALQESPLPLDVPGVDDQRAARTEMVDQLEDYVIPRLMTIDAPLLTVSVARPAPASRHWSTRWSADG